MKKINANKVYAFIGRALVYASLYVAAVVGTEGILTKQYLLNGRRNKKCF